MKMDTRDLRLNAPSGKTQVVVFLKNKGGVGCTTNAYNYACHAARSGLKVMLIDGDMQGDCTTLCQQKMAPGLYELLVNGRTFNDVLQMVPGELFGNPRGVLCVVPSDEASGKDIARHLQAEAAAARLDELRGWFDLVVVDTSPSASELHAGMYLGADWVIYPTQCQAEPVGAVRRSLAYYSNYAAAAASRQRRVARVLGVMPTMFRNREMLQHQFYGWLRGKYEGMVLEPISDRTAWQKAAAKRLPIFVWDPRSDAAQQACAIYDYMTGVIYGQD